MDDPSDELGPGLVDLTGTALTSLATMPTLDESPFVQCLRRVARMAEDPDAQTPVGFQSAL